MINDKENEYEKDEQNTLCHDGDVYKRQSQRRSCMLVAPFMGARSFPAVSLLPFNWIISHFPQSWKFLIFTLNSYFVDICLLYTSRCV